MELASICRRAHTELEGTAILSRSRGRDRWFESTFLQERVHCELDHDVELAVDVEITWHEQIAEEIERASEPGVDTAPSRKPPHFQAKPPADFANDGLGRPQAVVEIGWLQRTPTHCY